MGLLRVYREMELDLFVFMVVTSLKMKTLI